MLRKVLRKYFGKEYKNLNKIEISEQALINNFNYFQNQHPQAKVCPVLKSNAYGHGLGLLAEFIDQKIQPEFIIVDSLYEAYKIENINTPILIIGYTRPDNFKINKKLDFTFPVYDQQTIEVLAKYHPEAKVHLKIDSGMNRLGLMPNQVDDFIKLLKQYPRLNVTGIYTHLSQADNPQAIEFTNNQVKTFKKVIAEFEAKGFDFKWKHLAATSGSQVVDDPEFNLIRTGLGFYGISPFPKGTKKNKQLEKNLQPAIKFTTHLAQIKNIKKGAEVSYGGIYTAEKDMTIGILPAGYYDGVDRRLSNKGVVTIAGKACPILGRVCMNLTIVDLSKIENPEIEQEVVIYDNKTTSLNSVRKSADIANTIPYTLLVNLAPSTRRVLV
jgi:alanine racemase